jgi:hypothetical protein
MSLLKNSQHGRCFRIKFLHRQRSAACISTHLTQILTTYLLCDATVLVELWQPHIFYVKFRDNKFLEGGISPTPNPQPGGPGYLS